jgi:hypothetical protein
VAQNWKIYPTDVKAKDGRGLFIVCCTAAQRDEIVPLVSQLIERKVRLKEPTMLKETLAGGEYRKDLVLWWDIQNDWFLCLGENVAELLIKAIDALRQKWQKAA